MTDVTNTEDAQESERFLAMQAMVEEAAAELAPNPMAPVATGPFEYVMPSGNIRTDN